MANAKNEDRPPSTPPSAQEQKQESIEEMEEEIFEDNEPGYPGGPEGKSELGEPPSDLEATWGPGGVHLIHRNKQKKKRAA